MGEVLKKFGRYFLLDHLAQGGMAEIYRARMASPDGAGRLIVIKKIQAGYGGNSEFLQMFKSEIKVTMGFSHPNIVQLFDFGEENNQPYIAMEWLDGKNLRQFMSRFNDLKQTFPIELAAYIAEQSAAGLHYAHSYKDKITGAPLDIVHRDISPQNILISFEGNVKVIDFGIAKATTNSESTRAGVIKGKPSYLSPEQISGDELDGRSDIFALGTVLWELLTGRKLFAGENALAVLKLIESAQTHVKPPSTVNPKVPKELDAIVLKTLQKQREKRYQNAEELQRTLRKFLYTYSPDFNPSDLAQCAKELFKNEIVEDRKKIQRLSEKVEEILAIQHTSQIVVDNAPNIEIDQPRQKDGTPTLVDPRLRSSGGREAFTIHPEAGNFEMDKAPVREARTSTRTSYSQPTRQTSTSIRSQPSASQNRSRVPVNDPMGSSKSFGIIVGLVAVVAVVASFSGIRVPVVTDLMNSLMGKHEIALPNSERQTASTSAGSSDPGAPTTAPAGLSSTVLLKLNIFPNDGKTSLFLNGRALKNGTREVGVALNTSLDLLISRPNFKTFHREFVLDSTQVNGASEWPVDIYLEPNHFGYVSIHTTPSSDASLLFDGVTWKRKTPVENEKLPVGDYTIHLMNEVLGMEKDVHIHVEESRSLTVDEHLEIKN